jgi:hypothetical protein
MNKSPRCIMVAALLLSAAAEAQIYECFGPRGAREFAQVCPPGTLRQRQVSRGDEPSASAPQAPQTKSAVQQEIEFKKRLQERADAEAKANEERTKTEEAARNCAQARMQLKAMLEGQRMTRMDPDTGERVNFGDDERAAESERQRDLIAQWCK